MNLHALVAGAIGAVNPHVTITIKSSTGYTTRADGIREPRWSTPRRVRAQIQPLQATDLQLADRLNIQGNRRKVYLYGQTDGIVRADRKGGDVLTFPDKTEWLVVVQLETWGGKDGWTCVMCTQQNPAS